MFAVLKIFWSYYMSRRKNLFVLPGQIRSTFFGHNNPPHDCLGSKRIFRVYEAEKGGAGFQGPTEGPGFNLR